MSISGKSRADMQAKVTRKNMALHATDKENASDKGMLRSI
jgi:hypothetical protein